MAEGLQDELQGAELQKARALAKLIVDDKHFAAILQTAPFDRREELYNQIAPLLSFTPRKFWTYKWY